MPWLRAAGWIRVCWLICQSQQKYTGVCDFVDDPCRACVHTHAQEILINALHSCFDSTAHMHRQEIYYRSSHSNLNNVETKKAATALHLHRQTPGWASRPDIRKICLVFAVLGFVHQCVHAGVCQEFSHDILLSVSRAGWMSRLVRMKKRWQKKSGECHVLQYLHTCGAFIDEAWGVMWRWKRKDCIHFIPDWLSYPKAASWEFSDLPGTVPGKKNETALLQFSPPRFLKFPLFLKVEFLYEVSPDH